MSKGGVVIEVFPQSEVVACFNPVFGRIFNYLPRQSEYMMVTQGRIT